MEDSSIWQFWASGKATLLKICSSSDRDQPYEVAARWFINIFLILTVSLYGSDLEKFGGSLIKNYMIFMNLPFIYKNCIILSLSSIVTLKFTMCILLLSMTWSIFHDCKMPLLFFFSICDTLPYLYFAKLIVDFICFIQYWGTNKSWNPYLYLYFYPLLPVITE